jgi:hypothetical protein
MPMIKNDFKNDKNDIINLNEDEEELSVKSKSRGRKEKSGEKKEKIFDKNEIIENNKIRLNKLFILLEKQGIPNNLFIEKNDNIEKYIQINYDDSTKKRINSISFPTSSIFPYQSFDICPVNGINSYCISILFREENNINILTNIIIYFNIDNANQKIKIYQNESKDETEETTKLLYNQDIGTQIISCNDEYLLYSLTYKNTLQCNLIKLSSNIQNNLELFKITSKNLIIKTDFDIIYSKNQIRILFFHIQKAKFSFNLYDIDTEDNIHA